MKRLKVFLLTIMIILFSTITSFAGADNFSTVSDGNGGIKWIYYENGIPVTNRWIQNYKGNWYYAGADGYFLRNTWFQDTNGRWYYLGDDWAMLHDSTTPDGCTVGSDGAWIKDGQVVVETSAETTASK